MKRALRISAFIGTIVVIGAINLSKFGFEGETGMSLPAWLTFVFPSLISYYLFKEGHKYCKSKNIFFFIVIMLIILMGNLFLLRYEAKNGIMLSRWLTFFLPIVIFGFLILGNDLFSKKSNQKDISNENNDFEFF
jgi:hypothetical protein